MRLFVAVKVEQKILDEIEAKLGNLFVDEPNVKWVPSKSMHITLKFLGDTDKHKLEDIKNVLDKVNTKPFKLELFNCGAFPNIKQPNVFWIGVSGNIDQLKHLQKSVENNLTDVGFETEKRSFKPHLTIGRVKRPVNKETIAYIKSMKTHNFGSYTVKSFFLIESKLTPEGAIYTTIFEKALS